MLGSDSAGGPVLRTDSTGSRGVRDRLDWDGCASILIKMQLLLMRRLCTPKFYFSLGNQILLYFSGVEGVRAVGRTCKDGRNNMGKGGV